MAYGTYKVVYVQKGGAGTATTTENGKDESEVRKRIERRFPGCVIISIERK